MRTLVLLVALVFVSMQFDAVAMAAHKWGLNEGTPELQSADRLAFGPDGILLVGDAKSAAVFAMDTLDAQGEPAKVSYAVEKLDDLLRAALGGISPVVLNDLAVNPLSGNVYLAVSAGAEKKPAIVKLNTAGKASELALKKVFFLQAKLPNPPADKVTGEGPRAKNRRAEAITDLAYVAGKVLVSGVTNDASPANVREIPFPFADADTGTQVEIYHAAHGRLEDYAAVRTFVPFNVNGKPVLLAGFTCTPLVRISLGDLGAGKKVRGTTVAELGNRNTPLDMIAYEKNGERFLLLANSARGVMKIGTKDLGAEEGLTAPVKDGGTAGQSFEAVPELAGTVQLDRLNETLAVVVIQKEGGPSLRSVNLP